MTEGLHPMPRKRAPHPREHRVAVYLNQQELSQLRRLAETTGVDMSAVLRMLLKTSMDAMGAQTKESDE